jgi:hypothetical protein
MTNGSKKKSKKIPSRSLVEGPSIAANSYSGPIVGSVGKRGIDTITRVLTVRSGATASAGGIFNAAYSSDPTGLPQWVSAKADYDAYRVLGIKLIWCPYNRYNQTIAIAGATTCAPIYSAIDYNSAVAITSLQNACEFVSMELHSVSDYWVRQAKATNRDLMDWVDTNVAPTTVYSIKTRSDGNLANLVLAEVVVQYLIQFRSTL